MVREPDATLQPTPQDHQLLSKRRVLGFKPQPRLERRGQNRQHETEQPDHPASLGDSITSSTRTGFSVHTASAVLRNFVRHPKTTFSTLSANRRHHSITSSARASSGRATSILSDLAV
jgi:hypothetical protein